MCGYGVGVRAKTSLKRTFTHVYTSEIGTQTFCQVILSFSITMLAAARDGAFVRFNFYFSFLVSDRRRTYFLAEW